VRLRTGGSRIPKQDSPPTYVEPNFPTDEQRAYLSDLIKETGYKVKGINTMDRRDMSRAIGHILIKRQRDAERQ